MIKNPEKTKADFSKLFAEGRILIEQTGRDFFVAGPGGVWVAFEKTTIELSDIAMGASQLELLLKYDGELAQPKAGSLRQWQQLAERNLHTLNRRHKAYGRVDYYHRTSRLLKAGYFDKDSGVEVSVFTDTKRIKINFKVDDAYSVRVWKNKSNSELPVRTTYVLSQVLLADSGWQDPRPWLMLLERFQNQLDEGFRRCVYLKLINQYQADHRRSAHDKRTSVARLRAGWLQLSKRAWWEANSAVLIDMLKGAELFKPAERKRLFTSLVRDVAVQSAGSQKKSQPVENSWFSSWLPVAQPEPQETPLYSWPLSVTECLTALGYNSLKVQDDK